MRVLFALIFPLALCACAAHPAREDSQPGPARRIVSLMPSLTEDLCAIGARRRIVGVSQYSQDIPCVRGVPVVGSAASVDAERIVGLHADLVAGIPAQRAMTEPVRRAGIRTAFFRDDSFSDIFANIRDLGAASGHPAQARALVASLQAKTRALRATEIAGGRPRVFVVIQAQPIWTVGPQSYIATLVALAGGTNAVESLPQPYAQYSAEALVRLQPDVIVATNDSGLTSALSREPWRSLRAVARRRVYVTADDAILVRPGPRYNEGLAWLIERLRQPAK